VPQCAAWGSMTSGETVRTRMGEVQVHCMPVPARAMGDRASGKQGRVHCMLVPSEGPETCQTLTAIAISAPNSGTPPRRGFPPSSLSMRDHCFGCQRPRQRSLPCDAPGACGLPTWIAMPLQVR